ncbi:hypothetical protein B7463_g9155, partial [Scytalidium lignicola]
MEGGVTLHKADNGPNNGSRSLLKNLARPALDILLIYYNCTIIDGATTNGTFFVGAYNASAPVEHWHHRMELATIITANSLTFLITIARLWYRFATLKRFRGDDWWMVAAILFLIGYTASQVGSNIYGSGYHTINVPDAWLEWHWHFTVGYCGYYIIVSLIKASVCFCFLEILWVGLSIPIDLVLIFVPLKLLRSMKLHPREQRLLKLIFSANLLGTITCALGIYGVWENRTAAQLDEFYNETIFIMLNDIEILMYTLGATFPVFSRYIINILPTSARRPTDENFSSWARNIPTLFRSFAMREDGNVTPMEDLPNQHEQNRTPEKGVTEIFETRNKTVQQGNKRNIVVRERKMEPGCTHWFSLKPEDGSTSENEAILRLRSDSGTSSGAGLRPSTEGTPSV